MMTKIITNLMQLMRSQTHCNLTPIKRFNALIVRNISSSCALNTYQYDAEQHKPYPEPKRWPKRNEIIHKPPTGDEPPQQRYYCHYRANVKSSPKKMWYVISFVRGLSCDEAVRQLSFIPKKTAQILKEVILEARDIAVRDHNFQYKTNMWIAESFVGKGLVVRGLRKHARMRFGEVRYFHCHIFLRLVEGTAPDYEQYWGRGVTGKQHLERYIEGLRERKIEWGL